MRPRAVPLRPFEVAPDVTTNSLPGACRPQFGNRARCRRHSRMPLKTAGESPPDRPRNKVRRCARCRRLTQSFFFESLLIAPCKAFKLFTRRALIFLVIGRLE